MMRCNKKYNNMNVPFLPVGQYGRSAAQGSLSHQVGSDCLWNVRLVQDHHHFSSLKQFQIHLHLIHFIHTHTHTHTPHRGLIINQYTQKQLTVTMSLAN